MYCDDCGYELNGQDTCPVCGWKVPGNTPVFPVSPPPPQNIPVGNNVPPTPSGPIGGNVPPTPSGPVGNNVPPTPSRPIGGNIPPAQAVRPTPTTVTRTNVKKKKSKLPLIIISSLAVVGAATAFILHGNEKDSNKEADKNTTEISSDATSELTEIVDTTELSESVSTEAVSTEISSEEISTEDISTEDTTTETANTGSGTRTIMMYIVGSDLESENMAASTDIQEILDANFDETNVNYLIYTGGSKDWENENIDAKSNSTFIVENSALKLLEQAPATNMGDPSTLSDFITYCHNNYPADQYDLILWNHGGGIFGGYGLDELSGDRLLLEEIKTALNDSPFDAKNKLDFIGFDACLMANIELADILSPYANYLIASQESEPGCGWDYSFLDEIDSLSSTGELGECIVDKYIKTASSNFLLSLFSSNELTLSVMDLNKVQNVENALDNFAATANNDLNAATFSSFSRKRATAKKIAAPFQGEQDYDIVDLKNLAQVFAEDYPEEANAIIMALDDMIIYNDTTEDNANGVSIYWPQETRTEPKILTDYYKKFDFSENYTAFIQNYCKLLTGDNTLTAEFVSNDLVPEKNSDYTFSLQLTPEQASVIKGASFVISRADTETEGNVRFVEMSSEVSIDATNKLTANFDGNIIYMQNSKTKETHEIMYTMQEQTLLYTRYLIPSILYNDSPQEEDALYAYFVLETSLLNPTGEIVGCYPIMNYIQTEGEDVYPERYEIDFNAYENVAFGSYSHEFSGTENLDEFTESDWDDIILEYTSQPISDGFVTVREPMLDNIPYYGMFIIEDSQGKKHPSSLVQIK